MAGLKCHRLLWWTVHEPRAPELVPNAELRTTFDRGHSVGELARDEVPGGILIELDWRRAHLALRATRQAIDAGARVLYEACFESDGVFVAVDILERLERGWSLTEVKATWSVKPGHVPDAAIQTYVARGSGIDVARVGIMHPAPARTRKEAARFVRDDITEAVESWLPSVGSRVQTQLRVLQGGLPEVEPGAQCREPYECPFLGRCGVADSAS
jgi:hypothetical protein